MTSKMHKHVCFLISNLSGGGAQRVVSNLSQSLSSYYSLHIVLHDAKKIIYNYQGEILDLKTPVHKSVFLKALNFIIRIVKLKKIKRKLKPVAVISFMEGSNFINLLSGNKGKIIISVRNFKSQTGQNLMGRLNNILIKKLYLKSDSVVAVSNGVKSDLVNNFQLAESKITVIYNPYDLKYINNKALEPLDEQFSCYFEKPVLLTVGSLIKQKGQWHLIRAFKVIKKEVPDMKLLILGEGSLRQYLKQLLVELGLENEVLMPGFNNNPFKFMARSNVFVLPSLFEGFPNVLLEAMASGVPVIAADCPYGPREILAPETDFTYQTKDLEYATYGLLIPVLDGNLYDSNAPLSREEEILCRSVINLYRDQKLSESYSMKSKERIEDFEAGRITTQWMELIERK